jgi:feruloyl-CoA synthase
LRQKIVAAGAPLIDDVVIAGHDQERIGLLIFPNERACRVLCPELSPDYSLAALLRDVRVRARLNAALTELADRATGAAARPARALVMDEAPSADAGEITEKRYINQRAVLQRRAASVARLYADQPDADVLLLVR